MKKIKILHIDPDYQGHFVTIRNGKVMLNGLSP